MKFLVTCGLALVAGGANAATIYFDEASYLSDLTALSSVNSVISEGFEDTAVWGATRSSVAGFSTQPAVTSQGITYTTNQSFGAVATSSGAASQGDWGLFSYPHGNTTDSAGLGCATIDNPAPGSPCWQEDGWRLAAAVGDRLFGFGGYIDTNTGGGAKITFLLDGIDVKAEAPDNIDNINRDGFALPYYPAPTPAFFGVIDLAGFSTLEVRELSGKDFQQQYIFGDNFLIGSSADASAPLPAVPLPASGLLLMTALGALGLRRRSPMS